MNRKEPWEGYRRQAKRVSPVVSFPPSFARTFSSKERRLGTRQTAVAQRLKQAQVISPLIWHQPRDTDASVMISYKYWSSRPGHACPAINYFKVTFFGTFIIWISFVPIWLLYVLYLVVGLSLNPFSILAIHYFLQQTTGNNIIPKI